MSTSQDRSFWRIAGQHLVERLADRSISKGQLARALHVTPPVISHWSKGRQRPAPELLLKMLALFKRMGVVDRPEDVFDWVKWWGCDRTYLIQALRAQVRDGDQESASFVQWLEIWRATWRADPLAQGIELPGYYVLREVEMAQWRDRLRAETNYRTPAIKRFVLWGMAGAGKTVLAQALAFDGELNDYFRNGVLWAALGLEQTRGGKNRSDFGDMVQAVGAASPS